MAKVTRVYLPAESPAELGLEGDPIRLIVWANAPQAIHDAVWDNFSDEGRAKRVAAFHQLFEKSDPQAIETENGAVTLDFRTEEGAKTALEADLPDDVATWIVNLPMYARLYRREKIGELLPLSFGKTTS